jgi:hypothetical protein
MKDRQAGKYKTQWILEQADSFDEMTQLVPRGIGTIDTPFC